MLARLGPVVGAPERARRRQLEGLETVAVPEDLAEAEAELAFFVLVRDALDFSDIDNVAHLPRKVEVRFSRFAATWLDSSLGQSNCEFVLCICVTLEAAFDEAWRTFAERREGAIRVMLTP